MRGRNVMEIHKIVGVDGLVFMCVCVRFQCVSRDAAATRSRK